MCVITAETLPEEKSQCVQKFRVWTLYGSVVAACGTNGGSLELVSIVQTLLHRLPCDTTQSNHCFIASAGLLRSAKRCGIRLDNHKKSSRIKLGHESLLRADNAQYSADPRGLLDSLVDWEWSMKPTWWSDICNWYLYHVPTSLQTSYSIFFNPI